MTQTEELSTTFEDVEGPFTLPVLRDRVEEIVQENLVYRDAFRAYDATGIQSNVVQIPVREDNMAKPKIVDEGAEFPRSHEDYGFEEMFFDKFGFEVPITWEAEEDSRINLTSDQVDVQAREMAEDINMRAYEEIVGALREDGNNRVVSENGDEENADGTMSYNDILAGREDLVSKSYSPDLLIADVSAVHDLMKGDNFLRATEIGDSMRREGALGRIAGMDVVEDDSGLPITGNDDPGAIMIDTNYFGYEGERTPITTQEYSEDRSMTEVYRILSRMGWLVTENESAVIVDG